MILAFGTSISNVLEYSPTRGGNSISTIAILFMSFFPFFYFPIPKKIDPLHSRAALRDRGQVCLFSGKYFANIQIAPHCTTLLFTKSL